MRRGDPIVIHGDGTSLWTLTHQRDFAKGLVGLLGLPNAVGEAVHITTDLALTWDQVAEALARPLGVVPRIVHIASDQLARAIPDWAPALLGDWCHSEVYDNSNIKRLVPGFVADTPFATGAREIIEWSLANASRQGVDRSLDSLMSDLVARFG
jgi:nucleoside-diphosphate-sugar epimerase